MLGKTLEVVRIRFGNVVDYRTVKSSVVTVAAARSVSTLKPAVDTPVAMVPTGMRILVVTRDDRNERSGS